MELETENADLVVRRGTSDEVKLVVTNRYNPAHACENNFDDRGLVLKLSEILSGPVDGYATWTLTVPDGLEIDFVSVSGGLSASGVQGTFTGATGSGDFEVVNCNGVFRLQTEDGDIDAYGVVLTDGSSFTSASGTVRVKLGESAVHDLKIDSESGKAVLNYGGYPLRGSFEFTAEDRDGWINSPIVFDGEERFRRRGQRYIRKTFIRTTASPQITIGTATGQAALQQG